MSVTTLDTAAREIADGVAHRLKSIPFDYHIKDRVDGPYLVFDLAAPSERIYRALREAQSAADSDNPFRERATVAKRKANAPDRLALPETQLLKVTLSESLTVDRYTFADDFFGRYIPSVFGYEDQINSAANFIVYGRRGSGKSSLLAYAMHTARMQALPLAWIDMQAYATRSDSHVAADILSEILGQLMHYSHDQGVLSTLRDMLAQMADLDEEGADHALVRLVPKVRTALASIAEAQGNIAIFLDDLHVVALTAQPRLLARLYSVCRGNRCYLKISGIEQFTRPWDGTANIGLQSPNDAQALKLDYNLTIPDKSHDHIEQILDAHAKFCGLPSVAYICGKGVLARLVWVAAAVPRDALNLFSQAITRAGAQGQKKVSITSINAAASEMAEQKLRDMQQDASSETERLQLYLERIKSFCVSQRRTNAFLLEIRNDSETFQAVQDLIALRFVHVLHEGTTPHQAGRRYQALMLDYGFYVGIRAARSVDLFQKDPRRPSAQQLRRLPIFT